MKEKLVDKGKDTYKNASLKQIVEQLELCNYECEGGILTNNTAFIELKRRAEIEEASTNV